MRDPVRLGVSFYKGHGLGNDYLDFPEGTEWIATPEAVRRICHRTRGVGSDGIVAVLESAAPPFRLRMFNPDGSEFERSGNGLRIVAAYLAREGRVRIAEPFQVVVGGETLRLEILGVGRGVTEVAVEMGPARFGPAAVGAAPRDPGDLVHPELGPLDAELVSVGNPHCVVFRATAVREEVERLGPFLSRHPRFPAGINVQVVHVEGDGTLRIGIWERGVGPTSASGTSSCAAAAAAVRRGLLPPGRVRVRMPGGELVVRVTEGLEVTLEGPVEEVFEGRLSRSFLEGLSGC